MEREQQHQTKNQQNIQGQTAPQQQAAPQTPQNSAPPKAPVYSAVPPQINAQQAQVPQNSPAQQRQAAPQTSQNSAPQGGSVQNISGQQTQNTAAVPGQNSADSTAQIQMPQMSNLPQSEMREPPKEDPHHQQKDSMGNTLKRVANPKHAASLVKRGAHCVQTRGFEALGRGVEYRVNLLTGGPSWKYHSDIPLSKELRAQKKQVFTKMPFFSVIVPLYNTPIKYLKAMIKSVLNQSYKNFELVLIDASGPDHLNVSETVKKMGDRRILFTRLVKNEGISGNTNIGFKEANGDYFVMLDHDDTLAPCALYELAKAINEKDADFIYSDEAVLSDDMKKLVNFHFKPDYSPDYLRNCNYITHICAFSRTLLQQIGGEERSEFDGSQDYDLILRLTEKAKNIVHIPKILYYWRSHAASTAKDMATKPYALEAGANALREHLQRINLPGSVTAQKQNPGAYYIKYNVNNPGTLVSVVIPNKDHVNDLKRCISSIIKMGGHKNTEIIIVENNSELPETFTFYKALLSRFKNIKVIQYKGEFNFSAICNLGVKTAKGEHILLLNNDIELTSEDFITEMLSYSQRPDVGAVGAKLFYPDNALQHAGVFIGLGGSAGHNHKGHPAETGGAMYRVCTTQNMSAVTGACLMVKRELYVAMGGLDQNNFAVAYNDVDFCLKLRAKNLLNVMTPFATGYHYESKSRGDDTNCGGEKQQRYEREKSNFVTKYADIIKNGDPYYNPHLTLVHEHYGLK